MPGYAEAWEDDRETIKEALDRLKGGQTFLVASIIVDDDGDDSTIRAHAATARATTYLAKTAQTR
ncbi:hypothetical protein SAMN05444389_10517 [Paracoccus solventivorans]|uniref:Uncharacterized protein n=1 Tax=Paracoccus solventivorans TaxID=53463 RepID=A0A1M7GXB8_9RHOB|nr:hypothetical protein [Paracoccus solventivorans]SHM20537.1 hypothetical protein SAMN05444389_10517 [Paracoccus solventivorans]